MRKIIFILSLFLLSLAVKSQTYMADSAYVITEGGSGNILITDLTVPTVYIITRNNIKANRINALMIMAGRDTPDADTTKADGSTISGNLVEYTGEVTTNAHGIMDGYNLFDIKHNKVIRTAYGVVCEGTVTTTHSTFATQYNIFQTNRIYGTSTEGQQNKKYYNNTYYGGRHLDGYLIQFYLNNEATPNSRATGAEFKNNVVYSVLDSVILMVGEVEKATFDADYNMYWCEGSVDNKPYFYVQGEASNPLTFAQWQALGYDTHSRVQNPNFIDTLDFVPSSPLTYGTDLGDLYDTGLDTSYSYVAGTYPDTVAQGTVWQVGAVIYADIFEADYYVDPDGNDGAAGTLAAPWATPQKAFETAVAGDTVCFRGGTYYPMSYEAGADVYQYTPNAGKGNVGAADNRITFMGYPGETPIIDFTNIVPVTNYNIGLYMDSVHYVTFKNLTFQNLAMSDTAGPNVNVIEGHACSNITYDQIVIRNCGGGAFRSFSGIGEDVGITTDTTIFRNCDAFNNVDYGHNYADGFKYDQDKGAYVLIEGCRSMFNSDDGFDFSGSAVRVFKNNISFGNGWYEHGNGNGFKTGTVRDTMTYSTIIMVNNLSAYNRDISEDGGAGFGTPDFVVSDTSYFRSNARYYNNTSYKNDIGFIEFANALYPYRNSVYRNNIAYDSRYIQDGNPINVQILTYYYPESHNTWDWESGGYSFVETDTVTVTDADFVSVDSTLAVSQIMAARGTDGSLPSFDFMKLASTSDLIDKGTTYGWSEIESLVGSQAIGGSDPDIGYDEYGITEGEMSDVITDDPTPLFSRIAILKGNCTSGGGSTVTDRGICWSESSNPTVSDSHTHNGTGLGTFKSYVQLTSGITYYIRAYSTNSEGTSYGSNKVITMPEKTILKFGGKISKNNSRISVIK